MRSRRLAQVPTSDDEDDTPPVRTETKKRRLHLSDEDEEYDKHTTNDDLDGDDKDGKGMEDDAVVAEDEPEAVPLGEVVRVSGRGKGKKNHYASFEYDGNQYELEDPVLLVPEQREQKPYVAIIKDISQTRDGPVMITGQWFYRPEEAENRGGENWKSRDTRELFYSFHRDDVPAEAVMHRCVVHFIPLNKQIPKRKQHPGFIIQNVYDTVKKKLFKLSDNDYEDHKQDEINLLVQKTLSRIGDLPDIEPEDSNEEPRKNKRLLRKQTMTPLDVSKDDETPRTQSPKAQTPASVSSEYNIVLMNSKQLTGETHRDKWLEKLLQSIRFVCTSSGNKQNDEEAKNGSDVKISMVKNDGSGQSDKFHDKIPNVDASFKWPDAFVPAVVALEKAAHEALSADFQKYNQKLRQLTFNLKSNALLARRLLNGELEPAQILNMSPNELKEGLTGEEIARKQPEEPGQIQMTDARCKRCTVKQVKLIDIIQTGNSDRYKLECLACGNIYYSSRDDASTLTIEGPSSAKDVVLPQSAAAKFEDVEKGLVSPPRGRGETEPENDVVKKSIDAVIENQLSFNKTQVLGNADDNKH